MWKLAILIWLMLGTTLAGIAVIAVVSVPELYNQGMSLIPLAAGIGALVAVPGAYLIARRIYAPIAGR